MTNEEQVSSGLGDLRDRVGQLETRFEGMQKDLAENTKATKSIASDTADLVEFTKAVAWIAKIAKPASYVATFGAAIAGLWVSLKSGILPK